MQQNCGRWRQRGVWLLLVFPPQILMHSHFLLPSSPARPLGFTILGKTFAYVTILNPTTEVVTFRLPGWCMLDVILLPAFTRLEHERQDLLSLCDGMHVRTDYTSVYTLIRKSFLGNGATTHVNSKGKIPSTGNILPRGGLNPRRCIKQESKPNTLPTSYSAPPPPP